jgi:phage terminase large subunit-like protein
MGNAVTRTGPSENILLDKGKAKDRIDPVAALVNAFTRAMANEEKPAGRVFFA